MIVEQIAAGNHVVHDVERAISDLGMMQAEQPQDGMGMFSDESAGFPERSPTAPGFTIPQIEPAASRPLGLGSTHGPIVNAVFADGRVVTINQSLDAKLYSQIGIRDDGSPLSKPLVQVE